MFPHKQKELVDNLQNLGEKAISTPPSPDDIFSLDIFEDTTEDKVTSNFLSTPIGPVPKKGTWKSNPNSKSKHCLISAMQ